MQPVLVLGAAGQVGSELVRSYADTGRAVAVTRAECDLGDARAVRALVRRVAPSVILNPAAWTAVDAAEREEAAAFRINEALPAVLAEEARSSGALLVHYSTDYVFGGGKDSPYLEEDACRPLSVYGLSKLAGEERIRESGADHLILRTSWVHGARGRNFFTVMRSLARERDELRVVCDQVSAPTWCPGLVAATRTMVDTVERAPASARPELLGTYHLAGQGSASYHAFAEAIVEQLRLQESVRCRVVTAVTSAEYGAPARRPLMSVLSTGKAERVFGVTVPGWREVLGSRLV
jgi:dTDP-4-dehydrorhamnose reductase